MKKDSKIFVFHLLNDKSGSPKVLSQIIKNWIEQDYEIHLYTSLHQKGFLSDIDGVQYHNGWYKFKKNQWLRLLFYMLSQIILFIKMYQHLHKKDTVYINTVLPFGAALLGKLKKCRVIYHIHECSINPKILKWGLLKVVKWTASDVINVSKYVQDSHGIKNRDNHLVYNSLNSDFLIQTTPKTTKKQPQNILMVCSLKTYKGVFEFVKLASDFQQYQFRLVLNANPSEINSFFKGTFIPSNLRLYPSQNNLHPFFSWADVIVNLSKPDAWVETFGLTIIEGMAYGLPAIVPPVGGILEVIENGVTGFSVDSRNRDILNMQLEHLLKNQNVYETFSKACLNRVKLFKEEEMFEKINYIINKKIGNDHSFFQILENKSKTQNTIN